MGALMRLKEVLESHLDRDVTVPDLLSGSEPVWVCQRELEDLRESTGQVIGLIELDVPREEQLELFKRWLAGGAG